MSFSRKSNNTFKTSGLDPNYISTDVTIGNPRYELASLSDSRDATLVCVDANIAKPIERFVLGSTAATVIAGVNGSVLVSRKRSRTGDPRIVIGVTPIWGCYELEYAYVIHHLRHQAIRWK